MGVGRFGYSLGGGPGRRPSQDMRLNWTGVSWSGGPLWTGEGLLAGTEGAQRLQAWTETGRRLKSETKEARMNGVKLMEALKVGGPL